MFTRISKESRLVTPEESLTKIIPLNVFEGQRKLSKSLYMLYAKEMEAGRMRSVNIAFAILPDASKVLVNGQHVAYGIVEFGQPHMADIEYYQCETMDDVWILFTTFDTQKTRTQTDCMKAARGLLKDERLREIGLDVLTVCGSALAILEGGRTTNSRFQHHMGRVAKQYKPALVEKFPREVLFVNRFSERRHIMRVGVVTAVIATWRTSPNRADIFWPKISEGLGLDSPDDPCYKLRESLLGESRNLTTPNKTYYCMCVMWWNSWVTGDKRVQAKAQFIKTPPRIEGGEENVQAVA